MIPHPPELDSTYGTEATAPICRLRFTLTGADPVVVTPIGGSLSWDAGSWPRVTMRATLPTTITPTLLPDAISAYGGRVTVTLGQRIRGQERTFTAATLDVAQVDISRPDAAVVVTAVSSESRVSEDAYDAPTDLEGNTVAGAVTAIVRRTLPGVTVTDELGADGAELLGEGAYVLDGDVWPVVERIMDDTGAEAFFDHAGGLVMRSVPAVKTTPDLTIKVGGSGGTMTGYDSSRRWSPNRVVMRYTSPDAQTTLRYVWSDAIAPGAPAAGRVAANAASMPNVTLLRISRTDTNGDPASEAFAGLRVGDRIKVIDPDAGGTTARPYRPTTVAFKVTGTVVWQTSYIEVPVDAIRVTKHPNAAAPFPANKAVEVFVRVFARVQTGVWEDTRPTSPVRITGPYGRHTYREDIAVERGDLPDLDNADKAARQIARRVVGRLRGVTVRAVPAPWITPGDTIRLTMLGGLTEDHVVQSVRHPLLGLDTMTITTRDSAYIGGPF